MLPIRRQQLIDGTLSVAARIAVRSERTMQLNAPLPIRYIDGYGRLCMAP